MPVPLMHAQAAGDRNIGQEFAGVVSVHISNRKIDNDESSNDSPQMYVRLGWCDVYVFVHISHTQTDSPGSASPQHV